VAAAETPAELTSAQALQALNEKVDRLEGAMGRRPWANAPATRPNQGTDTQAPRRPLSEIRCYGCQQMGHYRSTCPYGQQAPAGPPAGAWQPAPPAGAPPAGTWPRSNRPPAGPPVGGWPGSPQGQAPMAPVDQAPQEDCWGAPSQNPLN
jgi:hypothetical protein